MFDLLYEIRKLECKPKRVCIEQNQKMSYEEESGKVDKGQYHKLMGKLIYLAHTRPSLAYETNMVIRFMHDLRVRHLYPIGHILKSVPP